MVASASEGLALLAAATLPDPSLLHRKPAASGGCHYHQQPAAAQPAAAQLAAAQPAAAQPAAAEPAAARPKNFEQPSATPRCGFTLGCMRCCSCFAGKRYSRPLASVLCLGASLAPRCRAARAPCGCAVWGYPTLWLLVLCCSRWLLICSHASVLTARSSLLSGPGAAAWGPSGPRWRAWRVPRRSW